VSCHPPTTHTSTDLPSRAPRNLHLQPSPCSVTHCPLRVLFNPHCANLDAQGLVVWGTFAGARKSAARRKRWPPARLCAPSCAPANHLPSRRLRGLPARVLPRTCRICVCLSLFSLSPRSSPSPTSCRARVVTDCFTPTPSPNPSRSRSHRLQRSLHQNRRRQRRHRRRQRQRRRSRRQGRRRRRRRRRRSRRRRSRWRRLLSQRRKAMMQVCLWVKCLLLILCSVMMPPLDCLYHVLFIPQAAC